MVVVNDEFQINLVPEDFLEHQLHTLVWIRMHSGGFANFPLQSESFGNMKHTTYVLRPLNMVPVLCQSAKQIKN